MAGSATIRFMNFPMTYDGNNFDVDFRIMLLIPATSSSTITNEMVDFNGSSVILPDPQAFELWIKDQVVNAWNDP